MTPGGYIRLRREAAGMSIRDVLRILAGGRWLSAPLAAIEADRAAPTGLDAALLSYAFPIDDRIVAALKAGEPVQACAGCGCSTGFECEEGDVGRCWLAPMRTCSVCRMLGCEAVAA